MKIPIDKKTRDNLEKARKKLSKVGIVPGKDLEKIEELYEYAMGKQGLILDNRKDIFKLLEYYQHFPSDFQMDLASNPSLISLNDYILLRKGQNLDLLKSRLGEKQVEGILKGIENKATESLTESKVEEKLVEERQRTLISEIFEEIGENDPGEYFTRMNTLKAKGLYISVPEYSMLRFYALGDELPSDIKKPSQEEITKTVEELKTRLGEDFDWFVEVTKKIELAEIQRQKSIQPFKERILKKYPLIKPVPKIVLHPLENFELKQKPIKVMFKLTDDQIPPYFNFVRFLGLVSTKLDQLK